MKPLVSRRLFILLLAFPLAVSIWGKTIHGTILDMHGEPVVGATIVEQNTSNGTVADLDGQFTMEVEDGKTIVVSYVGYRSQHIAITPRQTTYTITLQEDIEVLEDVVVIGYGTQKRSDVTGSISSVSSKEIADFSSKSLA